MRTKRIRALWAGLALLATGGSAATAALTVEHLRCEYRVNPLGIDVTQPHLTWILSADERDQQQTAYQVLVADNEADLAADKGNLWDSGKVVSDQSHLVAYTGAPMKSRMRCHWKVRVWDKAGNASPWSKPALWSMGLLEPSDWQGQWIGLDETKKDAGLDAMKADIRKAAWIWSPGGHPAESAPVGTVYFRHAVRLPTDRKVARAICAFTADNSGILFVNGTQAGSASSFKMATGIDVTTNLIEGTNVLAIAASNAGSSSNPAGMIACLRVEFEIGEPMTITTGAGWKVTDKETPGWEAAAFDASGWAAAQVLGTCGMAPWGDIDVGLSEDRVLPARMLRREFSAAKPVKRATAYICGLGYYELHLNGSKVGDHVLDPGLTDYSKRAFYVTYDVTDQLERGKNAIGAMLGNGRYYAPRLGEPTATVTYGYPKLRFQLHIDYADGTTETIVSDGSWKLTADGPIRANNDYDGETYDARMDQAGWNRAGFDEARWQPAQPVNAPGGALRAQMAEPHRVTKIMRPVAMTNPQDGVFIYDMGQNMVGWVRLIVQGTAGTTVTLRFAEVLDDDGMLYLANIRGAKVTDTYICKGDGVETYEPRFTYHGFRFVELRGFPGTPTLETIEGRVVHSDVERAGEFTCSNPLLNRIYRNVLWGIRGNLRSIPTDCPQRDERQGWLGDIANESKAESFDFNMARFFAKWLDDIEDAQKEDGNVPDVAPAFWPIYSANVTWPSAYIIIPDWYYNQYADARPIVAHYDSMKRWIDFMSGFLKDDIMPRDQYGDWCVPPESPDLIHSADPARKTSKEVLGTTYFCHDLRLMARYATILGKDADAKAFNARADRLQAAFNKRFLDKTKPQYDNGTQTSSVLPLSFGMVPAAQRTPLFANLVENILVKTDGHLATGLIGGQWLMRVLSDNGRPDVAYTIATQTAYPSWGYMIEKDATTIWELWNGDTANPAMNSHNHLMLVGDLCVWFYEYLGGIQSDPEQPGFKHIVMRPVPTGDLTHAKASHNSMHGRIVSDWRIVDETTFTWNITVPANTTATVYIPTSDPAKVTEGGIAAEKATGVKFLRTEEDRAVYQVGSGDYAFSAPFSRAKP
ncbi:MAG: family 78 glycoside hydrolase catalytic domain [Phycisphaerae bacterium]|nr:family 78 glycoside hydrolase catalytic domain [Phycisphaerae bacterium]